METGSGFFFQLSRRSLLGLVTFGVGLSLVPRNLRAGTGDTKAVIASTFDGDSLLVADQNLYRSDNGGASWDELPLPAGGAISTLATHPDRPGRVLAGLASGGIYLSENGGRTWVARASDLPSGAVTAIVMAATLPDKIYAAVEGDGLWKSEDAGQSWTFVMDRPFLMEAERDLLTLASVNLATGMGGIWIYAGTGVGLTRVPDCFCRWQDIQSTDAMDSLITGDALPANAPLPDGETVYSLVSAQSAPELLYAALPSGVWFSADAGVVWTRVTVGNATSVAVHPINANHIVAAVDGDIKQSRDSGANWSTLAVV